MNTILVHKTTPKSPKTMIKFMDDIMIVYTYYPKAIPDRMSRGNPMVCVILRGRYDDIFPTIDRPGREV